MHNAKKAQTMKTTYNNVIISAMAVETLWMGYQVKCPSTNTFFYQIVGFKGLTTVELKGLGVCVYKQMMWWRACWKETFAGTI